MTIAVNRNFLNCDSLRWSHTHFRRCLFAFCRRAQRRAQITRRYFFSVQPVARDSRSSPLARSAEKLRLFCRLICLRLHQPLVPSRSTSDIASFSPAWKIPFLLTRKISRISNRKVWLNPMFPCIWVVADESFDYICTSHVSFHMSTFSYSSYTGIIGTHTTR